MMLKGHLPRVIYHQVYYYTKIMERDRERVCVCERESASESERARTVVEVGGPERVCDPPGVVHLVRKVDVRLPRRPGVRRLQ